MIFREMMKNAEHSCLSLLRNCKNLRSIEQLHAHVQKLGFGSDPFIFGKLLLHCAVRIADDALGYAKRLLFHASNADVFMYNTLIRGLAESDEPESSLAMFKHMLKSPKKLYPDSFSFAFLLKAAANMRCLTTGSQLHCSAIAYGYDTHIFVGTTLISLYAECGCVGFAQKVFDEMRERNIVAWNAIVTAYFRCNDLKGAEKMCGLMPFRNLTSMNLMLAGYTKAGEVELAKNVFAEMETRDDVSWSTMIVGFAHNGFFAEAFGLFRELLRAGLRPNEVSLTGVLSACAQAGAFEFGKILHGFVEKSGLNYMIAVNNALLDAYCKCGDVDMARLVFERMPVKGNIVSWTAIIAGMAMQGYGGEAIRLFNQMEDEGIRPDGVTFVSILYACSHAGLIEQGCEIFEKMTKVYGIKPEMEHYGCMVDLYGRAGQLQTAYDFVIQMPIPPNDIVWRTLLGACSFFGNINLAEQVKEKLFELDPNNSGDHVLLSNVYAIKGEWKDVIAVRRTMAAQKLKKTPGWSMIEIDKVMYSFVAGEKLDKVTEEANNKLKQIILKLKLEGGYVPEVDNVLHDIELEEKEDSVTTHSEKLAVAFGIARLPEGKPIRIVKNLRMCKDCHTVMKLISKVYRVEILVRDRSRFHSIKKGSCSCRDYW